MEKKCKIALRFENFLKSKNIDFTVDSVFSDRTIFRLSVCSFLSSYDFRSCRIRIPYWQIFSKSDGSLCLVIWEK